MNITLKDQVKVSQFSSIMKNLKNFSSDIEIIINEHRLYAQGMDSSHVCLYELVLYNDWFCEYNVDKSYVLGLNCEMLSKVLNCLSSEQANQVPNKNIQGDRRHIPFICRIGCKDRE